MNRYNVLLRLIEAVENILSQEAVILEEKQDEVKEKKKEAEFNPYLAQDEEDRLFREMTLGLEVVNDQ